MNIKIGTINFMGIRNVAFAVTLILTVIALGSWFTKASTSASTSPAVR